MRKVFCFLLSMVVLLSFAACVEKDEAALTRKDKKQIEELILCRVKVLYGIATEEEYRKVWSEKFWEKATAPDRPSFEELYELSLRTRDPETDELRSEMLVRRLGEDYTVSVKITEMQAISKKDLKKFERTFEDSYHYDVDLEKACFVKATVCFTGDQDFVEVEFEEPVYLFDERWCIR